MFFNHFYRSRVEVLRLESQKPQVARWRKRNLFRWAPSFYSKILEWISLLFSSIVVDQRRAPCTSTEMRLCVAFSSHRRYPSPSGRGWFSFLTAWTATMTVTFRSISMDVSDTEAILSPFSQTSSRSSSRTPHSVFASLQPELAWSSAGSHLTNCPLIGDVSDSLGFLIKWTWSACKEFRLLAFS